MKRTVPTAEYVRDALDYEPDTGRLIWKARPLEHFPSDAAQRAHITRCAGKRAGCIDHYGHRIVSMCGNRLRAGRLIYLWMTGEWPNVVDHINGDPADDRWENLRNVSQRQNMLNCKRSKNNTSGTNGVYFSKRERKWKAEIKVRRQKVCLGTFAELAAAISARKAADAKYGYANGVRTS